MVTRSKLTPPGDLLRSYPDLDLDDGAAGGLSISEITKVLGLDTVGGGAGLKRANLYV